MHARDITTPIQAVFAGRRDSASAYVCICCECCTCWGTGRARARRLRARVRAHDVCLADRSDGGRAAVRRERLRDALPIEGVLAVARSACGCRCTVSSADLRSSHVLALPHPETHVAAAQVDSQVCARDALCS